MAETKVSVTSALSTILSLGSLGAGGYHGYMDAMGNPLSERLETTLTWAPAVAGAAVSGIAGLLECAEGGSMIRKDEADDGTMGPVAGAVSGAMFGTAWGVGYRGVQTLVGYGIGYMVGAILR